MKRIRENNQGSTLLLVIIAMMFVGLLGITAVMATTTNTQMKEVLRSSQMNFYNTDAILERITVGLGKISSQAAEKAYVEYLENYSSYTDKEAAQKEFNQLYLKELSKNLTSDGSQLEVTDEYTYSKEVILTILNKDSIHSGEPDLSEYYFDEGTYPLVFKAENYLILKDIAVKVTYNTYETIIRADIKMISPSMFFTSNFGVFSELTSYALIADHKIITNGNVGINGNAYAGTRNREDNLPTYVGSSLSESMAGFDIQNGTVEFTGNILISRGDIFVSNGGKFYAGNESRNEAVNLWVENIRIGKEGQPSLNPSFFQVYGFCNVEDDLEINGKDDVVNLIGEYYGYHYNKDEGNPASEKRAAFSSAMLINGKDATLNMERLRKLVLSGRTYISRNGTNLPGVSLPNEDIMLGESLATKSDQVAYYVPVMFIQDSGGVITFDTDAYEEYIGFIDYYKENAPDGGTPKKLIHLLNTVTPITPYYLKPGEKYYYLNFKDEVCANEFYEIFYHLHKDFLNNSSERYLSQGGIRIGESAVLLLSGNVLYREIESGDLKLQLGNTNPSNDVILQTYAETKAKEYKSRQLGLVKTSSLMFGTPRLEDKRENPLFERLIDMTRISALPVGAVEEYQVDSSQSNVWIVNGDYTQDIPEGKGIIVATGNVTVKENFSGMILAGKSIIMDGNSGTGITIKENQSYVKTLFSKSPSDSFTEYFLDYSKNDGSENESIQYGDYIYYENWRKN